jgi:hypothetical protein
LNSRINDRRQVKAFYVFFVGFRLGQYFEVEVEVEVTLRLTVSQSVCFYIGHPFGAHDEILLFPFFCRKIGTFSVLYKN